jgi:hypothetical protein
LGGVLEPDKNVYRLDTHIRYDIDKGELHEIDGMMTRVTEVRKSVLEKTTRQALILELERLGYTVISPEGSQETHGT